MAEGELLWGPGKPPKFDPFGWGLISTMLLPPSACRNRRIFDSVVGRLLFIVWAPLRGTD